MAGQILQHRAYIGGIEVPIISVAVSTTENSVWQANIQCPWSPFLTKLPKNTKITVFRRNTDLFNDYRLLCDGCLAGVTEARSWKGQAQIILHITSDASILGWRRKQIINLEFSLSKAALQMSQMGGDSQNTVTNMNNIVPVELSMFANNELVNGDACKAAAYFLSGTPTDNSPGGKKFHDNTRMIASNGSGGDDYDYLSPFMKRFYGDFQLARKICHVPLPKVWVDAIADDKNWEMMMGKVNNAEGMVSYWELGRYLISWFQGSILSIPDATYIGKPTGDEQITKLKAPDSMTPKFGESAESAKVTMGDSIDALGELILMPHNYFGNAPLCNIIFPDQIISRSVVTNHGFEYTRAGIVGQGVPESMTNVYSGLTCYNYVAPSGLGGYFESFNFDVDTPAGKRSEYENQFGVSYVTVPISEGMLRLWNTSVETSETPNSTSKKAAPKETINTMNHEFMIAYSQKYSLSVEVMPDVEVVPGSSVILLDQDGEHWFAYCRGVSYSWTIEGQASVTLQLTFAHHHSWSFEGAMHYGNSLSKQNPELIKIYSTLVGCKVEEDDNEVVAQKYFKLWKNTYKEDSRQMKYFSQLTDIVRDVCTMQEYVTFMNGDWSEVETYDFTYDSTFTTLGSTLVDLFDCSEEMASLSTAYYSYYDAFNDTTLKAIAYKPPFSEIGKPGKIIPSTYISGIVDCHLKWLHNVGHAMSV